MSSDLDNFFDFNNNQDLPYGQWILQISNKKRDKIIQLIRDVVLNNSLIITGNHTVIKDKLINFNKFKLELIENYTIIDESTVEFLNDEQNDQLLTTIRQLLNHEYISESNSKWSSSIVPIKNENNIYLNYQKLNNQIKDFQLPIKFKTIDDVLNSIKEKPILFSKLKINDNVYYQIELDDESSKLTAFNTKFGKYEFKRLHYNLKNSSAYLQYILENTIYEQLDNEEISLFKTKKNINTIYLNSVKIYLTEILIINSEQDIQLHIGIINIILRRLKKINLKINIDRSSFLLKNEINCFNRKLTTDGYCMLNNHLLYLINYKKPKNAIELAYFLISAYESIKYMNLDEKLFNIFLDNFSKNLIDPLNKFQWNENNNYLFNLLKAKLHQSTMIKYSI